MSMDQSRFHGVKANWVRSFMSADHYRPHCNSHYDKLVSIIGCQQRIRCLTHVQTTQAHTSTNTHLHTSRRPIHTYTCALVLKASSYMSSDLQKLFSLP